MIKSVIFDMGGVLIDYPLPEMKAYCAKHLGALPEKLDNAVERFRFDFARGTVSEDEFWERVCSEVGIPKPLIKSLWGDAFRRSYSEKKEMFALARFLRGSGYKIGFLSNTEVPAMNYFLEKRYDIFDVTVFSCLEGTIKPEREIYEITLNRLGVKPEEAVFIDDREKNIDGAERVGIKGILFKNPEQAKKELASFSVNVD